MKKFQLAFWLSIFNCSLLLGQSNPTASRPDITITHVMNIQLHVTRLAMDPITRHLFYTTSEGSIYEVHQPIGSSAYDSLVADSNMHGITYVQGLCFHDSVMYVSGNTTSATPLTRGVISRGVLQSDGSRIWSEVAHSDLYETADYFDHLFSGSIINPTGDSIYVCSGSRGDHGEVQTRYGLYPNIRNKALTSCILRIPLNANAMLIPDDSLALDAQALVLCRGIRNTYDFAYDGQGHLFGVENSGDRDMDDEMNWIRADHHYGFPWMMGSTFNPQQYAGFIPADDSLINHASTSWQQSFFSNDPNFPQPPPGLTFTLPCKNYGPDGDFFRDTITGAFLDASALDTAIYSFTAHRSPLGLVFDNDSVMDSEFRGHAFVSCYTGGDTAVAGASPLLTPFHDIGEDILHLEIVRDTLNDNFSFHATRIAEGFGHPVDQEIDSNVIYLVEVSYGPTASLWAITIPSLSLKVGENDALRAGVFPNPCTNDLFVKYELKNSERSAFSLYDQQGKCVYVSALSEAMNSNQLHIDTSSLTAGIYIGRLQNGTAVSNLKIVIMH